MMRSPPREVRGRADAALRRLSSGTSARSAYRDEVWRALESTCRAQNEYLKEIRDRHEALRQFDRVEELLGLLRDPQAPAKTKNAVLLALLLEHQRGGSAFALLALAMLPVLDRAYWLRVQRASDRDELWARIVEGFAEALDRYPIARRRERVAANIAGETRAAMHRAALRDRRFALARERLHAQIAPFAIDIEAVDPREPEKQLWLGDFTGIRSGPTSAHDVAALAAAATAIAPLFDAAAIANNDRFLVLGVIVHHRTLRDLALELGVTRSAAKKRYLRALHRLRALGQRPGDDLR